MLNYFQPCNLFLGFCRRCQIYESVTSDAPAGKNVHSSNSLQARASECSQSVTFDFLYILFITSSCQCPYDMFISYKIIKCICFLRPRRIALRNANRPKLAELKTKLLKRKKFQ